ncbi:ankyrin repeat domain-containing protein [Janthinobacterium sp. 1_2014MBL_MicDiv]|uniref:ankyrin repeat domain-containing protein n=1 Tax=Janthinobacterium sp. 1_2014MBL_MicDiv TaxID=1644131 RepID=UPI0008F4DF03|nr:ankyrin repeat domain-containing protein [Janthinobacterium sp. 1_2014MBL_MicDiv]APA68786.1 hypothetical protein YQ44_14325 [Janthinobacterium sp. 1_2014MBL_MicDiv]
MYEKKRTTTKFLLSQLKSLVIGIVALCIYAEAHACDGLIGSYAVQEGELARIWIEHQEQDYVLSTYDPEKKAWTSYQVPLTPMTREQFSQIPVQMDAASCALAGAGVFFVKTFSGAQFSGVAASQNVAAPMRTSKTGTVLVSLEGFAPGGMDLFPVRQAIKPPAAAKSEYCAHGMATDMSLSAFHALPPDLKRLRQSENFQREVMCGQYLHGLMAGSENPTSSPANDALARDAVLRHIRVLLAAGSVPRTANGESAWWEASRRFLAGSEPPIFPNQTIPAMRQDYYAFFAEEILPRLAASRPDPADHGNTWLLARHTVNLPDDVALRTLDVIKAMQVPGELVKFHKYLVDEVLGKVRVGALAKPVFDWLTREAGMAALDASSVLDHVIVHDDVAGVRRLLAAGASPLNRWAAPNVLSQSAAATAYKSALIEYIHGGKGKLQPDVANDLLRRALDDCNGNDAISLAFLLGADPTRFFLHPTIPKNVLAVRLLYCPSVLGPLLKAGMRLDQRYPLSIARDGETDTPLGGYLRMRDPAGRLSAQSADVVRMLLSSHNNANEVANNGSGNPLLKYAIDTGSMDIVKTMLDFGAAPQAKDTEGFPAWLRVLDGDKDDILLQIMQARPDLDLNASPDERITPLAYAECLGAPRVASILRQRGALEKGTALCRQAGKRT